MSKNGQILVLFIVFLPIFCLVGILAIDIGLASREKVRVESATRIIMKEVGKKEINENTETDIRELFKKNNINIDNLKINIEANGITIENHYTINSIFGNLINIRNYRIEINHNFVSVIEFKEE